MRTTLDIDDDVLAAAKERGRLEKKTAGEVISELARKGLTGPSSGQSPTEYIVKDGWVVLPSRGGVVTNELIEKIERELDQEELERAIALGYQRPSRADE